MARPLSVQLFALRDELAADRPGTIKRLAEIGYDAVETHRPTDNPAELRKLLDDAGIFVSATHCRAHKEDRQPIFAAAKTLGTDRLIIPGGIEHEEFTTEEGIERTATLLNGIAKQVEDEGLRLGYHNHWWEIEPVIGDRHAIEVLADQLEPSVFLEIDTYWAAVGGADVVALLNRLGERVQALHIKDGPIVKGEPHTAVGAGKMPIADIIAAAPQAQLVVELDRSATDMMAAVADSHAYLADLVAQEQA
jgi:sugar phosphate isomerase/epimerase